uniref:Uncharacterized protein n=1 Tax=Anopheles stephensi TaxID=30069 RepID=A0A182YAE4_ANOST
MHLSLFRCFALYCAVFAVLLRTTIGERRRQEASWIKPGALDRWGQLQGRHRTEPSAGSGGDALQCDCPPPPEPTPASANAGEDERLALVFYRKLIKTLFARDTLTVDGADQQDYYTTEWHLKISNRQLEKLLDDSCSAREINLIVSAVLGTSSSARRSSIFPENQCERLYNFLMQLFGSKILHNLLPVVLLIAACFLVRIIARITRLNSLLVVVLLAFSINFCSKWKECNENLAMQSLQNLEKPPTSTVWTFVSGTRPDGGDPLLVCDPLHVFLQSTASIQAVYFRSVFKELLDTFNETTRGAGWFQTAVTGLLMLGFCYMVLSSLMTVGLSSGFQMVGSVISAGIQSSRTRLAAGNEPVANNAQQQQQLPAVNLNFHIGDGLARSVSFRELVRQESQRIETVSNEPTAVQAIEEENGDEVVEALASTTTTAATADKVEELNGKTVAAIQTNEEK